MVLNRLSPSERQWKAGFDLMTQASIKRESRSDIWPKNLRLLVWLYFNQKFKNPVVMAQPPNNLTWMTSTFQLVQLFQFGVFRTLQSTGVQGTLTWHARFEQTYWGIASTYKSFVKKIQMMLPAGNMLHYQLNVCQTRYKTSRKFLVIDFWSARVWNQ